MILDTHGLSYAYPGADRKALGGVDFGLDFGIDEGEVFGFLGPNGSGKTTTQKLLTRILRGYGGSVDVFGRDLREHDDGYYNSIGVCFEFPNLYEKLTAEENLEFYRAFFDAPTDEAGTVLARLDLPVGDKRNVGQWSKGMKMRLTLARSLVNRPRLWFLDEPTTGQDPQHAVLIRRLIRERARAGTSVFLTTHDMAVADELCDRVAFLVDGRIALVGSPRTLKLAHARKVVRVEYHEGPDIPDVPEIDDTMRRDFDLDVAQERSAFADLVQNRDVLTIHTQEPSLEDVFLEVTGRELLE